MARQPLLVIVGQTAVGKTALSLKIAQKWGGEIVSADSRLFYRGMDIGTAKPSAEELATAPHHLIDICEPNETVTLGQYQEMAFEQIDGILARGKLPILVGGTGQYVKAVVEGWGIPRVPPQPKLRAQLERLGKDELARWLAYLDPVVAKKHDPRNVRRVVRALEVTLVSGRPISELQKKTSPPYDIYIVGLHRDRSVLYERIDQRVDLMMAAGLLAEVEGLHKAGFDRKLSAMSGLGYRQILDYLVGERSLSEAVERVKFETHRFARQQTTWFRLDDPTINWFDLGEVGMETAVFQHIQQWLGNSNETLLSA